jgi:hypothetical protein
MAKVKPKRPQALGCNATRRGVRMVEWARELGALADHVGEFVRQVQHPPPTVVR